MKSFLARTSEIESRVTWRNEGFTNTVNEWNATYHRASELKLVFKDQVHRR